MRNEAAETHLLLVGVNLEVRREAHGRDLRQHGGRTNRSLRYRAKTSSQHLTKKQTKRDVTMGENGKTHEMGLFRSNAWIGESWRAELSGFIGSSL